MHRVLVNRTNEFMAHVKTKERGREGEGQAWQYEANN